MKPILKDGKVFAVIDTKRIISITEVIYGNMLTRIRLSLDFGKTDVIDLPLSVDDVWRQIVA